MNTPIGPVPFEFVFPAGKPTSSNFLSNRDGRLSFAVTPVGAAITAFKLQVRYHPSSDFVDRLSGTDFQSTTNPEVIGGSASIQTTADGSVGWAELNIGLVYDFRFLITCTGAVTLRGVH